MSNIKIQNKFMGEINEPELSKLFTNSTKARELLYNKQGKGNDFLGWVNLPNQITDSQLADIQTTKQYICENSDYHVVVGIGGSYLGAKAIIDACNSSFSIYKNLKFSPKILYAGHHLNSVYLSELLDFLKDKDFTVNVISKSGTTTEPAIAFRFLLSLLEKKYSKAEVSKRVIATTDANKGALKKLSDEYGFKTFVIPDDVGGRYSVLTPVGLLPIAVSGVDIQSLVDGARSMASELKNKTKPEENLACIYASYRNYLYRTGKKVEILVNYNPSLHFFTEWWKQLFGESEGKQGKGIFPAGVNCTTDLHSLGQYIQDGERILFETVLSFEKQSKEIIIEEMTGDPDGLNYLKGKTLSYIESMANLGTQLAHFEGKTPVLELKMNELTPFTMGELIYFFEYACGVSGYMNDINPFDQPGVEDYKNNMFALLGKKGYEEKTKIVRGKLSL